jgi:Xaa-Pro aminopeptidase
MMSLKSPREIEVMRAANLIVAEVLAQLRENPAVEFARSVEIRR